MKKQKLSTWQCGEIRPTLRGIYQRRLHKDSKIWYGYWNGKYWESLASSVAWARQYHKLTPIKSVIQDGMMWRGVL